MNPYCHNSINFENLPKKFPPQHQSVQPGIESIMVPNPIFDNPDYRGSGKLKGKSVLITGGDSGIGRAVSIAFAKEGANIVISYLYENDDAETGSGKLKGKSVLITGGDSGIGRAVSIAFAKEGANIVISYLYENDDAETTKKYVEKYGGKCHLVPGDISNKNFCEKLVRFTVETLGGIDVLINNAGVQFPQNNINCISQEQLELTFKINIFSMFYLTQEALKYMKRGSTIVNTISNKNFCEKLVRFTVETLGGIDVLINNAGVQFPQNNINCISQEQLESTLKIYIFSMFYLTPEVLNYMKRGSSLVNTTNCISQEQLESTLKIYIFSMFYLTPEVLNYMKRGSSLVNTTSVTAYQGKENLIDYSSTKGAVVTFTRSLSQSIVKNGIRVNAVCLPRQGKSYRLLLNKRCCSYIYKITFTINR